MLQKLIKVGRLPDYVFIANRAKKVVPAYSIGSDVSVSIPNGPVIRHEELAVVRARLTDYLHETKVLGKDGLSDKLHVRGVNSNTLGLRSPLFYLKKYNQGEERFWSPVFENKTKTGIYTYAGENQRDMAYADGLEVLQLRTLIGELLISRDRLTDLSDLRTDRLRPDYWQQVKSQLSPLDHPLQLGDYEMETYQYKQEFIAIEHRPPEERETEDRYGLYFGESYDDLAAKVKTDFKRRELI